MIADPEHDRIVELLGVYALHAVDPDEDRLVEEHLATCARCRAEVDGLRRVAADLAVAGALDGAEPPPRVWSGIAAGIGAREVGIPPATPLAPGASRRVRSARRRRPGRPSPTWIAAAVGVAAAVAIALLSFGLVNAQGHVDRLRASLGGSAAQVALRAALESPGHQVAELRSSAGSRLVELVVRRDGAGYVVRSTAATLPPDQTYQLWGNIGGRAISLGLLGRRPAPGAAFTLGTSGSITRELMVTIEPAGGVPTPDRAPIATAPLSLT